MNKIFNGWTTGLLLATVLFYTSGCEKNPAEPDNKEVSPSVQVAADNSVEVYNTVASVKQITEVMQGPDANFGLDIPGMESPQNAAKLASGVTNDVLTALQKDQRFTDGTRIQADSVLWDVTIRNNLFGFTVRRSLLYDPATGHARVFEVKYDFDQRHRLAYDSTEVKADLNFTIFDSTDDLLLSVVSLKKYKDGSFLQEESALFTPDTYPAGTLPTGGVFESTTTYNASSFIQRTHVRAELHDGSGSFLKEVDYSDGTHSSEAITFNPDGTGTFSQTGRLGVTIEGTFDSAVPDNQGGFTKTTTFPSGGIASIYEAGQFSLEVSDSTLHGSYEKEIRFRAGTVSRESIKVDEQIVNGVKQTVIEVSKADGSGGKITIAPGLGYEQVTGEWTNVDDTFCVFSAESYPDGSGHLKYSLYASKAAYENGDAPIGSGEFNFYPDGSGVGTVTDNGVTYQITIPAYGEQQITRQ